MKHFLMVVLLSLCSLVAFAGTKPTNAIFTMCKVEFKVLENGKSCAGKVVKSKAGEFRGQNFYFEAKDGEWEERKLVLLPSNDSEITFLLRAPNGAVAEYKSFKIDGEEKLTEPFILPYSKKQKPLKFTAAMTKDKEMVITFQIRKSGKTPADFQTK